ncbi:MAG: type II secretion system protein GspM [Gammaproteobacteria bacterium]
MKQELLAPAQEWFDSLAPRERIMVSVCGVFIVLAVIWSGIIQPIYTGTAELEDRVMNKTAQLASLQEQASKIPNYSDASSGASGPRPGSSNESIVVVIDRSVRSRQLQQFLKRNQPDGSGGVRLRFEGAAFDDLIGLLGELHQSYGMTLVSGNFDEAGPGRVNCSLVVAVVGA